MAEFGLCPTCKKVKVARKPGKGKTKRCAECIKKVLDTDHYDSNGIRYGTPGRVIRRTCQYCSVEYPRRAKGEPVKPACDECLPLHREVQKENYKAIKPFFPYLQKDVQAKKRIKNKMKKAGLPEDWYEKQPKKCGVCETTHPGRRGRWNIDHDHRCCAPPRRGVVVGCHKCIRGLLCIKCNMALGLFKDSPELLRKALRWLEVNQIKLL